MPRMQRDVLRREVELRLSAHPDSVAAARRHIATLAAAFVPRDRQSDLTLVVSEVVSNAIRHGAEGSTIELRAVPGDDHLRVEVTDAGPGLAPRPRATEPSEGGGFGLFLVDQLVRRWGLVRQRGTTRVWFEFDLE